MSSRVQKERAAQFRRFHHGAPLLVLPNVWDAASARIVAQAGFRAIAYSPICLMMAAMTMTFVTLESR
jgi:2-methylisocitrate lyase-like PEP mutase family enzyme